MPSALRLGDFPRVNIVYSTEQLMQIINADFPALKVEKLTLIGGGWSNYAYRANDDLLFKFPKNRAASSSIRKEVALLGILHQRLQIVPQAEFVGRLSDGREDFDYFGYRMLPGVFLSNFYSDALDRPARAAALEQVARFTAALRQLPVEQAEACGVEALDFKEVCAADLSAVRGELAAVLPADEHSWLADSFVVYLSDEENFEYAPSMLHGDLRPDHILFDATRRRLTRVIDFGGAIIGDPDYDLMYLLDEYGASFVHAFMEYHPNPNPPGLIRKLKFFLDWEMVHLLLHGVRNGKEGEINTARKFLRRSFQARLAEGQA